MMLKQKNLKKNGLRLGLIKHFSYTSIKNNEHIFQLKADVANVNHLLQDSYSKTYDTVVQLYTCCKMCHFRYFYIFIYIYHFLWSCFNGFGTNL